MKKIFSILILFFAFSLSANAQETFSEDVREATKKQAYEIANYFEITDMQKINDINNMLLHKKKVETTDFSLERKISISNNLKKKFASMLDEKQLAKFKKNEAFLDAYF
jgi:hypothetical protein